MIFRTTLKAGQTNVLNKTGRHFYLLTAADEVRVRFRDGTNHTVDFESPLREGMSADFAVGIDEITLTTETAQHIEFWLGETKLDYAKITAIGAGSSIAAANVFCDLGKTLAIPFNVTRKSVILQPTDDILIGGVDVSEAAGFKVLAGEKLRLDVRGDIYTYITPAYLKVTPVATNVLPIWDDQSATTTDSLSSLNKCPITGNLISADNKIYYSIDDGVTWSESVMGGVNFLGAGIKPKYIGSNDNGVYFVNSQGKIIFSDDGGLNFKLFTDVKYGYFIDGTVISDGLVIAAGEISIDSQSIIVCGSYNGVNAIFESHNGGASWQLLPAVLGAGAASVVAVRRLQDKSIFAYLDSSVVGGYILRFSGQYGAWEKVINGSYLTEGNEAVAAFANHVYVLIDDGRLFYSNDYGETFSTLLNNASASKGAKHLLRVGQSIVMGCVDYLGLIDKAGNQPVFYDSGIVSAKNRASAICFTGDAVIIKQGNWSGNGTEGYAHSYPVSALGGRFNGCAVQWLAELN